MLIALIVLYVGSQLASSLLMAVTADRNQRMLMIAPAVPVRRSSSSSFPAGLLVYWITTNLWTIVQQWIVRRRVGPLQPPWPSPPEPPPRSAAEAEKREPRPRGRRARVSLKLRPSPVRARRRRRRARRRRIGAPPVSSSESHDDDTRPARRPTAPRRSASCSRRSWTHSASTRTSRSTEDEETLTGTLEGEDLGLFIGRHGQTIDAVQHLAQRIVQRDQAAGRRVVVDCAGYRERRAEILHRQADQAAEEAIRFARPVALDAMTAGERRVVHEYLRERGDVETYSEGTEPERHLVVAPLTT